MTSLQRKVRENTLVRQYHQTNHPSKSRRSKFQYQVDFLELLEKHRSLRVHQIKEVNETQEGWPTDGFSSLQPTINRNPTAPASSDDQPKTKGPGKDICQALPSRKSSKKDLPNTFQYTSPITTPESSSSPVSPDVSGVSPANANSTVPSSTQQSASKIGSSSQMQSSTPNSIPKNSQPGQQTSSSSQPGGSIQSSSISSPTDGRSRYQPSNAPSNNLEAPSVSSEKMRFQK
ncbi:hypothetical protein JTE90_017994 [Oedothorax gibbosus]|uniref:Uncharacterized protein n=1 Tax=Oedothorax gibbosus TaxID=931172 RepID=A0AAV6V6X6_9ARAC|nr:hypothetical protein JTE90_017994 [Oedothorax gibbosus]